MATLICLIVRLFRWAIYADCTCPDRPQLDRDHREDCPHPLRRRHPAKGQRP